MHELTVPEIAKLVQSFVHAGVRAREAGFDAIEVHGAHGLINRFLSPHTSHREDAYGGDERRRPLPARDPWTVSARRWVATSR